MILNQETNGANESYGGSSFEWCLKNLEKQGLLGRVHKKKKETIIIPYVKRMEYIMQREELETVI